VGHVPVIMIPPNAPPGHLPGRHHPLVRTWVVPTGSFPVLQAPSVAGVSAVAMLPGMPPAPGAQQPRRTVGPSLASGAFQTGLDVQQARALAAGTLQRFPDAEIEATWDVGLRRWTVQHRLPQNDTGHDK